MHGRNPDRRSTRCTHASSGCPPQLNPDEQVRLHLKHHAVGKRGFYAVEQPR